MSIKYIVLSLALGAICHSAYSDVSATFSASNGETTTISTKGQKIRMEHIGPKDKSLMIFDQNTQNFIIADVQQKSFIKMNKSRIDAISQQFKIMQEQIQSQLQGMPPEQRKMMEDMMAQQMPQMASASKGDISKNVTYKSLNSTEKVGEFSCKVKEKYIDNVKTDSFCITNHNNSKILKELFTSLKGMMSVFDDFLKSMPMGQQEESPMQDLTALGGLPVKIVEYENGKVSNTIRLTSLENKTLNKGLFNAPAGFTEQVMEQMMGAPGQ